MTVSTVQYSNDVLCYCAPKAFIDFALAFGLIQSLKIKFFTNGFFIFIRSCSKEAFFSIN